MSSVTEAVSIIALVSERGLRPQNGRDENRHLTSRKPSPFIRYAIGDTVTLGAHQCPCGRGLPWLVRVEGKTRVAFRLADGRLKNSVPLAILLGKLGGHHQHQVVQRALEQVVVRIVPNRGWSDEHPERLRHLVRDFFEGPVQVDIEIKERLELPPSGKFQSMVCEVA